MKFNLRIETLLLTGSILAHFSETLKLVRTVRTKTLPREVHPAKISNWVNVSNFEHDATSTMRHYQDDVVRVMTTLYRVHNAACLSDWTRDPFP